MLAASGDPDQLLLRARLLSSVPELRARMLEQQDGGNELLASLLAARHLGADDLGVRVLASALGGAVIAAVDAWQKDGGKSDLLEIVDRAIDALAAGLRELDAESSG
jgi:hypothetical protein